MVRQHLELFISAGVKQILNQFAYVTGACCNVNGRDAWNIAQHVCSPGPLCPAGFVVLSIPKGTYLLTQRLWIKRPRLVLRGAGRGQTIFSIPKSLTGVYGPNLNDKRGAYVNTGACRHAHSGCLRHRQPWFGCVLQGVKLTSSLCRCICLDQGRGWRGQPVGHGQQVCRQGQPVGSGESWHRTAAAWGTLPVAALLPLPFAAPLQVLSSAPLPARHPAG
jgi:hypothetical protein